MSDHSVPVLVMSGITLYVGVYHLVLYLRRRSNRQDLTFSLTCLVVCVYGLLSVGLYNAGSLDEGRAWQRWQVVLLGASGITMTWFISDYTRRMPDVVRYALTTYFVLAVGLDLFDRSALTWTGDPAVKHVALPFGREATYYEDTPGPAVLLQSLIGLLVFVYAFYLGVRMYRAGERAKAVPLIAGMALFFLGVFNDTAVSMGSYQSIYVIEYSYMGIILLMAYGLSSELVTAAKVEAALRESEARLVQAEKMESIGRLAGGIAHDFNNMLTPILGYAQIASRELPADHPLQEILHEIQESADQASSLTRQLLAFSRRQVLATRVVDLNEIVSEFEPTLRRLIREDVELRIELAPELAATRADPVQIHQILMNLAANAWDAMPGGGRLTLATRGVTLDDAYAQRHPDAKPGEFVRLAVSDSGSGIDDETLARIFEPFFTTKHVGKGTGLGLATVYGIVNQHGGSIAVHSEAGRGTTFHVHLPSVDGVPDGTPRGPQAGEPPRGDETVLVVEDEPRVRAMARQVLEGLGYRVLLAADGDEALAIVRSESSEGSGIDLLLTDVIMPGMNGRELFEQVRSLRPGLGVLYMSGHAEDAIGTDVLDEGIELLRKPFQVSELGWRVRQVLDG